MMEIHNKNSKIAKDTDHAPFELNTNTPDSDVMNARRHILTKDVEVQTRKIRSKSIGVQIRNTYEKTYLFDDEEINGQRNIKRVEVEVQTEPVTITPNMEATREPQNMTYPHVMITVDASLDTAESYLDLTGQEVFDQSRSSIVMKDIVQTIDNSVTHNHRMVDTAAGELAQVTTTTITDIQANLGAVVGYASEPLLPLSKACAPLHDTISNLSFYVQLAMDETPEQPPDGITIDESAAIRLYTIEWGHGQRSLYSMLNYTLKNDTRENLRPYFKYMKLFLTALAKLPCVPPLTIWRGVTKDLSTEFPPGTSVTWWPFSSCTTELTVLENNMYLGTAGNRTLFSVEVINGRTIKAHSHFVTEDEILLLPGTQMIVQSQFSPASDLHIIHLKQVIPAEVLLELPFEGARLYPKTKRPWYRKKRFAIPICLFTILAITATIVGAVLGTRSTITNTKSPCISPFQAAEIYKFAKGPTSATIGYFRNDRDQDMAVTIAPGHSLAILINDGNGHYHYPGIYTAGQDPQSVISADFNGDNKVDLAVANSGDNSVSVLLGNGDGAFQTPMNYTVGQDPRSVISADFNGDNKVDLAMANSGDKSVSVLLGNGDGTFQTPINYPVGPYPWSVISADFNGDNKLDLAVSNYLDNTVSVLLGNGDGAFQTPMNYTVGQYPISVISADFNGDNKVDLAMANSGDNTVSVLLGIGDGAFETPMNYTVGQDPQSVISADFNGDNKLDLAVANYLDNSVSVLLGIGDGAFETLINYTVGQNPISVISADFNGDNKVDLAMANSGDKSVSVLLGNGDGAFQTPMNYTVGQDPQSVISADFNGDNKVDLAVANSGDNSVSLVLGIGDGTFHAQRTLNVGNGATSVISGDVNNDQKSDLIVVIFSSDTVSVFLNKCD